MQPNDCHHLSTRPSGSRWIWVGALAVLLSACGSHNEEDGQPNDPMIMFAPEPAANRATESTGAGSGGAPGSEMTERELAELNALLREYVRATRRVPKEMNELVSSGFLPSLPSPPPGKKFVILLHPLGYQVVLADR